VSHTLFGQSFSFSDDYQRDVVMLRFEVQPSQSLKDAARSCGFRPDGKDSLTWVRKLDSNGKAAARYFTRDAEGRP
jgi:hypothetical protein